MSTSPHIRLSELTSSIARTINDGFGNQHYWIVAEVTNYSFQSSKGHHYFDLVEKASSGTQIIAKMQAAAWSQGHDRIQEFQRVTGQQFRNDIEVMLKVSVSYHSSFGLKLTLLDVDSNFTIGALELQKQQTLQRLVAENPGVIRKAGDQYITPNKEKPLPRVLQRIAVITSSSSAGLQDFLHTLESNSFGYKITIDPFYTIVQGEARADLIYNKLLDVYNSGIPYDVVVMIRGGGAQTDFLIFDQYPLAKIVARFPIPIITGIGHQINQTVADMMAHTSVKTPTKAAEFIIAHNRAFEDGIVALQKTILIRSQQMFLKQNKLLADLKSTVTNKTQLLLNEHRSFLLKAHQTVVNQSGEILLEKNRELLKLCSVVLTRPRIIVSTQQHSLANMVGTIKLFSANLLKNQQSYLAHHKTIARMMAPDNILKKGFAIVKVDGEVTSDPGKAENGKNISVILKDIEIVATVNQKKEYDGKDFIV
ncbi:exodeoxyribonuclease VII large subunit [Terrimonas sp. NA20]|uniref:Exodeoxyribonuclease 7 large subunit n=1 Tax=Terrimonas ginsenosidimutans TaxID=2908004 RepID=A0ABS9KT83_9BACT|nr:exodeoxyribonuclease VII large subunit [Terrimonas ginsenosidimutans]MCG2615493.1 exodeoxyribonuclease VII large subunit [Terrimonas ginsenosidimutans]